MPRKLLEDARICLSLLTRLPIPMPKEILDEDGDGIQDLERIGKAYRAAPLVGVVTGVVGALAYFIGISMSGNPVYIAAILAISAQLLISGGSQEIGFTKVLSLRPHPSADTQGRDEDMGVAVGAIAAGLMLLLKIHLVAELANPWIAAMGLIASAAFGRAAQVQLMAFTSKDSATQPSKIDATTSMFVGAIIGIVTIMMATIGESFGASVIGFAKTVLGAFFGMGASAALFFSLTKCRHHLDNVNVKEAVGWVTEMGALYGIVAFMPVIGL
jgi:cobalamin synthase